MFAREKMDWRSFWQSPQGRTALAWERLAFSSCSRRELGDTAIQIGAEHFDALANCSIAHHILACTDREADCCGGTRQVVVAQPDALPFADDCADFLVWPHGFNVCEHPTLVLAEIYRVLAPNGLLAVTFFNSLGPWGIKSRLPFASPLYPSGMHSMSLLRAKSALTNAGLTLHGGFFGVYSVNNPTATNPASLLPTNWDKAGDRWWPTFCNAVLLLARKHVGGMRLIGKLKFSPSHPVIAAAPVAQKQAADSPSADFS